MATLIQMRDSPVNKPRMVPLPESIVGRNVLYIPKVIGDSMIDGGATVMTFSKKDGHIWLLPANDSYA